MDSKSSNSITGVGREYFYSVESLDNSFSDYEFWGDFDECVSYCLSMSYDNSNARIALICTDDGLYSHCVYVCYYWCGEF